MNHADDTLDALIDDALAPIARIECSRGFTTRVMRRVDVPSSFGPLWRVATVATAVTLVVLATWLRHAYDTSSAAPQDVHVLEGRPLPTASLTIAASTRPAPRESALLVTSQRIPVRRDLARGVTSPSVPTYDGLSFDAVPIVAVDAGTHPLALSPVPQLSPLVIDHVAIAPIDTTSPASPATPDQSGGLR